jgi:hypothetical protein
MFKTNDDRLDQVLEFVGEFFPNVESLVKKRIDSLGSQQDAIASALSLGKRTGGDSVDETKRRNGVRTALFLLFTEGGQPLELAETFRSKYLSMDLEKLKQNIRGRLPVVEFTPKRALWDLGKFTAVPRTPQLQDAPPNFCYLVFGMMNTAPKGGAPYQDILGNPEIVKRFLLSTSIIDESHRSTYYPYGLILQAPTENIISTHTKDQTFRNYIADDPQNPMKPAVKNDSLDEIRKAAGRFDFRSPDEILAGTKPLGDLGYNEIVVMGRSPTGAQISIQGFFMKVSSAKERFIRFRGGSGSNPEKAPFVTDSINQMMLDTGLPIVQIVDASGGGK